MNLEPMDAEAKLSHRVSVVIEQETFLAMCAAIRAAQRTVDNTDQLALATAFISANDHPPENWSDVVREFHESDAALRQALKPFEREPR
jgi:hypothetical protein